MTPTKKSISKALTFVQYGTMALLIFGQRFPQVANHPIYVRVQQNRWMYMIGSYFVFNTVQKSLSQSGAFEVYIDDQLIFSKLDEGRLPTFPEILSKIKSV
jgi:selT/selW/selH-like putative selenoprotein